MAGDGEEPGRQAAVVGQVPAVTGEAQPGFFQEILRDIAPPAQTDQKTEEARAELLVYRLECSRVTGLETGDQLKLGFSIHNLYNAGHMPA